ncbi:hypothetical protein HDU93_006304, partial [Gonapodya sp. JEL0774]
MPATAVLSESDYPVPREPPKIPSRNSGVKPHIPAMPRPPQPEFEIKRPKAATDFGIRDDMSEPEPDHMETYVPSRLLGPKQTVIAEDQILAHTAALLDRDRTFAEALKRAYPELAEMPTALALVSAAQSDPELSDLIRWDYAKKRKRAKDTFVLGGHDEKQTEQLED